MEAAHTSIAAWFAHPQSRELCPVTYHDLPVTAEYLPASADASACDPPPKCELPALTCLFAEESVKSIEDERADDRCPDHFEGHRFGERGDQRLTKQAVQQDVYQFVERRRTR